MASFRKLDIVPPPYDHFRDRSGEREQFEESLRFAFSLLESLASEYEHGGDLTKQRQASRAFDAIRRLFSSERNLRGDTKILARENEMLRNTCFELISKSPTTVEVVWSEEIDEWCRHSLHNWQVVRDNKSGYYLFEDIKSAALFKLHWG